MDASRSPASTVGAGFSSGSAFIAGWLIERPSFHRGAGLSSGPAFIAGLADRAAQLSSRGWLFEQPGFHRGTGLSSGPAFIAGLVYRAARLSSRGWLFERPGFHRGAGLSSGPAFIAGWLIEDAEFLSAPDLPGCETRPDIHRAISAAYNRLHITPRGSSLHDPDEWYARRELPPEWKR
jgi:hypothetical protein